MNFTHLGNPNIFSVAGFQSGPMWQFRCRVEVWQGHDDAHWSDELRLRGFRPRRKPWPLTRRAGAVRGWNGHIAEHHSRTEQEDGLAKGTEVMKQGVRGREREFLVLAINHRVVPSVNQEISGQRLHPGLWFQTSCPTDCPTAAQRGTVPPLLLLNQHQVAEVLHCLVSISKTQSASMKSGHTLYNVQCVEYFRH